MGTTKLTRKQILAEDPVHEAIVQIAEFARANAKKVGIIAAVAILIGLGIYIGLQYLERRELQAQELLSKGIEFFHAQIDPDAADDPYAKGPNPVFRNDELKYKAALKEFSSIVSRFGYAKVSIVARYYQGLCQLKLGQKTEALQALEAVASNSKNRTVGYLAKKVLAAESMGAGNYKRAEEILQGMLKDPRCNLPRQELSLQLSEALVALGKRDEAIKVLKDASAQGPAFGVFKQKLTAELDKLEKVSKTGSASAAQRP